MRVELTVRVGALFGDPSTSVRCGFALNLIRAPNLKIPVRGPFRELGEGLSSSRDRPENPP